MSMLASPKPFDYANYLQSRDRQWTREILAEYVPHFVGCRKVLDLACGPGIFLELLAEQGINAVGVDRNNSLAEGVRIQSLEVIEQDVFTFLAQCRDTYDGVFCSHFLEHLPFDQVLHLMELIVPRLERGGVLVIVLPNPESIRMHLFGFWRDPEHVRFYHPESIELVCQHYGLNVVYTNRQEAPFAIPALPALNPSPPEPDEALVEKPTWLRKLVRGPYLTLLRALRLVPKADLVVLEQRLRGEIEALRQTVTPWAATATWAINRMWAWPDNAVIVCRKPEP